MKQTETNLDKIYIKLLTCELCKYSTYKKSQYDRHLLTSKHKLNNKINKMKQNQILSNEYLEKFKCNCGIICKSRTTLWRHRKNCKPPTTSIENTSSSVQDNKQINTLIEVLNNIIEQLKLERDEKKNEQKEIKSLMVKLIENTASNNLNNV